MTTQQAELQFQSEDLENHPFDFAKRQNNGRAKILFVIDVQIGSDTIARLQSLIGFIRSMMQTNPAIANSIEIILYLSLKRVAAVSGNRNAIRSIIGQVLKQFNLSTDDLENIVAADWDGRGVSDVRLSIERMSDPHAVIAGENVPEFDVGSFWVIVTNNSNMICSTLFGVPVPEEEEPFADFINDVIAAMPNAAAQHEVANAFNAFYAPPPADSSADQG